MYNVLLLGAVKRDGGLPPRVNLSRALLRATARAIVSSTRMGWLWAHLMISSRINRMTSAICLISTHRVKTEP